MENVCAQDKGGKIIVCIAWGLGTIISAAALSLLPVRGETLHRLPPDSVADAGRMPDWRGSVEIGIIMSSQDDAPEKVAIKLALDVPGERASGPKISSVPSCPGVKQISPDSLPLSRDFAAYVANAIKGPTFSILATTENAEEPLKNSCLVFLNA